MRFFVVVVLLHLASTSKTAKKVKDTSIFDKKPVGKAKPFPPAIIAIEIVDPNENKTSKNSKRTIGASLGYGYQSPPRFQVYKYSQHDIPAYQGHQTIFNGGGKHHYDVQKSVSYKLPSQTLNQYYQPGTTLFSTVNSQGHVGGLTQHLPQQSYEPHVPVIILRVFPSQLADPSAVLHPNLPQSHPLASTINSIDIQSLLAKYVQSALVEQNQHPQQYHYHNQPEPQYQYQYQPQQYHHHQHDDRLLTHENYPKETHTRVIFKTDKNKIPKPETKTIRIAVPSHTFSAVQVETPSMQYSYSSQDDGQYYQPSGGDGQYYQQSGDEGQGYYYQPEGQYQQVEQQYEQPEQHIQNDSPHNYHAHQKRSKQSWSSRFSLQGNTPQDVIKLQPIKA